jgi:hypothetical protein
MSTWCTVCDNMPEITIKITVPEGATVNVAEAALDASAIEWKTEPPDWVGRYWRQYLSKNGRTVFGQAARTEQVKGRGYTLEELAHYLSIDYESIKSFHRSAGRSAKRWRQQTGTREPIYLDPVEYSWNEKAQGNRTTYRLPPGVADQIAELERSSS